MNHLTNFEYTLFIQLIIICKLLAGAMNEINNLHVNCIKIDYGKVFLIYTK